ncbi:hypothetical protein FUA23_03695 [Neolewinella aurantiaca]|uniref:Uncharacterized protein n=1 Tax=Neolewinella aurantiaca TaxID=2602767 RepID=A0A5C7FID5_9BACT|nr:hypothetical protein [Neolewinella aurantiaca]TXF90913.1 hypothetical protein FUA23_03695 [Neolewinella aurantiaca]
MSPEDRLLATLREKIEAQLGWGHGKQWTNNDFQELSDRINEATSVALSPSTLKRVWGRVAYTSQPSTTTLDALAAFAGFEHWRAFRAAAPAAPVSAAPQAAAKAEIPDARPATGWKRYRWPAGLMMLAVLALLIYQLFAPAPAPAKTLASPINPDDYHLSFRPVTSGVPNSVIFNYTADKAPADSVFLQQSWDRRRREKLDRNANTHTSIYYLPGYFNAKLVVNDQVVKERELYLRSDGWVAAVKVDPVPVYLPLNEVQRDGRLAITEAQLTGLGLNLQPEPPTTVLSNVGQTEGVWSNDFTFQTRLRHDYAKGAAACQHARVILLLKNSAIIIPLSAPGCVADLSLFAGGQSLEGRNTDLSAFGVVGDSWIDLACTGKEGLLTFSINGRQVLQLESKETPREMVGIRYEFTGMGSVDEVRIGNREGEVWVEEF